MSEDEDIEDIEDVSDDEHATRLENVASALEEFAKILSKGRVSREERERMASTMGDMAAVCWDAAAKMMP